MSGTEHKFKPPPAPKPIQKPVQPIQTPPVAAKKRIPMKPQHPLLRKSTDEPDVIEEVGPDPFIKSKLVFGLNERNFNQFMKDKDVAFIYFYDNTDSSVHWCGPRLAQAAAITKRENHAYAAVDCIENPCLCYRQSAINVPAYILYSKGRKVLKIRETTDVTSENMKNYVENAPPSAPPRAILPICELPRP